MSPRTQNDSPSMSSPPDGELIRLCVERKDADAFEALMSRYHERVYGSIMRQVRDSERARDLTQETFLKAWRALDRFEGTAGFYTWIYRIARNLVASDYRKLAARPRVQVSLDRGAAAIQPLSTLPSASRCAASSMGRDRRKKCWHDSYVLFLTQWTASKQTRPRSDAPDAQSQHI